MPRHLYQLFASLCCLSVCLSAQTLFGVTGTDGEASILYSVNTTNGATTVIGPTGFNGVGALAFNGTTLYGVANIGHRLITINTTTGTGTPVSANATGTGNIADIAFRADGTLFASGGGDGASPLYTINTTTGVATLIGTMSGAGGGNGLAFNSAGTLYLAGFSALYTVNPATAATTQVATLDFGDTNDIFAGMKFNPNTGVLFGTTHGQLGSVNVFNGNVIVTVLGNTGADLEAVAFGTGGTAPPPPPTVPAPSTLLLLGTGAIMMMGWFLLRGRRTLRS
jgi:WD40 repeat protein